jgi:hypothetical protein
MRLLKLVETRKKRIAKSSYKEKYDQELSPYEIANQSLRISDWLLNHQSHNPIKSQASLRDRFHLLIYRFTFLMSNFGILRGESLFKAELSDLTSIELVNEGTIHKCTVLVMRIAIGKTNELKTLYGRIMRHKSLHLCGIGALAMYLFSRFHVSNEVINLISNDAVYKF